MSDVSKKKYHHGDLRNTLIDAGVEMLAQEGIQTLSLRKLAQRAGVSHNAPYMHFADKEALLAAIAEDGFRQLALNFKKAVGESAEDWQARLYAGCGAYVKFALTHPNQLQVMIRPFDSEKYQSLSITSLAALEQLQEIVIEGQVAGQVKDGDSFEIATVIWTLLHGISAIWAGQKMPSAVVGGLDPQQLTENFVAHLCTGICD